MSEISDRPVTEEEFTKFKASYEKANRNAFTWDKFQIYKNHFKTALPFMFKREDINKNVFDRNIKKIMEGNFNGLCMIDIKVQLAQEIEEQNQEIEKNSVEQSQPESKRRRADSNISAEPVLTSAEKVASIKHARQRRQKLQDALERL